MSSANIKDRKGKKRKHKLPYHLHDNSINTVVGNFWFEETPNTLLEDREC
jgi:hypothetical protein